MSDQATDRVPPPTAAGRLPVKVPLRGGGLVVAGVLAAVGILFTWQSSLLELGNIGLPGPGFFPLVLAILVVAFAVLIGIDRWRTPANETVELGHRDVLMVVAACLMVPPLFELLGAYITLGLFGAVMLVFLARVSLMLAVAAAAIAMVGCWYFFEQLLGITLPTGPF